MLHAWEQHARSVGFREAILLTGPDQHPAVDLYERRGYVVTATERHGPPVGVRMQKRLDSGG